MLPGRTHYAPTKLGLEALTRNMAAEMTPLGIRVNCVHPGLIDTDTTAWVMKDPELLPIILEQISMGRAGVPRDVARVVAFLVSEEAVRRAEDAGLLWLTAQPARSCIAGRKPRPTPRPYRSSRAI